MRPPPAAGLVAICVALAACGNTKPRPEGDPGAKPVVPVKKAKQVRSWDDVSLVATTSPPLVVPKPGTQVLARWSLPKEIHYREGVVVSAGLDETIVRFRDKNTEGVPTRAVIANPGIKPGTIIYYGKRPMVFVRMDGEHDAIAHPVGDATTKIKLLRHRLRVVMRTDHNLPAWLDASTHKVGDRVLAKWDARAWWVGRIIDVRGEAVHIRYDDRSRKWIPANHAIRLARLVPGLPVVGINKRDGQPVPATLVNTTSDTATMRFFDGTTRTLPLGKLATYVDQVGLDYGDPCKHAGPDKRALAKTMRGWLTKQVHFYTVYPNPQQTSPVEVELGFALYLPKDRPAGKNWKQRMQLLADQVERFLRLELRGVKVNAWVHAQPVVSTHTLAWLKQNLRESDSWHVWQPTGESVRKLFPDGTKKGRHRIAVVVPDAPGISSDSSGVEKRMGFVRARGAFFEHITEAGLIAVSKGATPKTSFHQWRENYLATTLAHEALHTLGLPHTDGDPWSVMNIGPWYPITRPQVHVAKLHKLVLRSPFTAQGLSQGYAHFLMETDASYLDVIGNRQRLDTSLALAYAGGPGHFTLLRTLRAFQKGTRLHQGARIYTGERAIVRAYLASLVHFVADVYGPSTLVKVFTAPASGAPAALAKAAGVDQGTLQVRWHQWLEQHLKKRAHK